MLVGQGVEPDHYEECAASEEKKGLSRCALDVVKFIATTSYIENWQA
jgi:hypothetical protein